MYRYTEKLNVIRYIDISKHHRRASTIFDHQKIMTLMSLNILRKKFVHYFNFRLDTIQTSGCYHIATKKLKAFFLFKKPTAQSNNLRQIYLRKLIMKITG